MDNPHAVSICVKNGKRWKPATFGPSAVNEALGIRAFGYDPGRPVSVSLDELEKLTKGGSR